MANGPKLPPPASKLLPPSTALRPFREGGGSARADEPLLDPDMVADLQRRGSEAGAFAKRATSSAAAMAAEKVPEFGRVVRENLATATRAAFNAEQRRGFMQRRGKLVGVAAAAVAATAVGGWFYAGHIASQNAELQVREFLIRNNLARSVTYSSVSASPFGNIAIKDVAIHDTSDGVTVRFAQVGLSDIQRRGSIITGGALRLRGMSMPLVPLIRSAQEMVRGSMAYGNGFGSPYGGILAQSGALRAGGALLSHGYKSLRGDVTMGFGSDATAKSTDLHIVVDLTDLGSLDLTIGLSNVDTALLNLVPQLVSGGTAGEMASLIGSGAVAYQFALQVALTQVSFSADNRFYKRRQGEVETRATPDDTSDLSVFGHLMDAQQLTRRGMALGDAQTAERIFDNWDAKGGVLRVETRLSQPLPLLRGGTLAGIQMAFSDLNEFLAITQATVSER